MPNVSTTWLTLNGIPCVNHLSQDIISFFKDILRGNPRSPEYPILLFYRLEIREYSSICLNTRPTVNQQPALESSCNYDLSFIPSSSFPVPVRQHERLIHTETSCLKVQVCRIITLTSLFYTNNWHK